MSMPPSPPVRLPDRISGFRSAAINGIIDYLESLRPLPSRTIRHEWRRSGLVSHAWQNASDGSFAFPRLFELYDFTLTTVKVRGLSDLNDELSDIAGVWRQVGTGTAELDTAITISGYSVIWIKSDRATNTATLEVTADTLANWQSNGLPNGTDEYAVQPLWWIPWDSTKSQINLLSVTYLGDAPSIPAMA